jgi:uncharacterized protein (DUF302 family)/uncharacterized membrane protein YidH (DUF202 family)
LIRIAGQTGRGKYRSRQKIMDAQPETKRADLRDYLAAERTLLAWIRTGLSLMGFGFVVARFGVFLREIQAALPAEKSFGLSLWFGTALIGVGIFVNLFAAWRHARMVRELNRGEEIQFRPSMLIIAIACVLALIGLVMAIYLISLQTSAGRQPDHRKETSMTLSQGAGIVDVPSNHPVEETVQKLKQFLQAKGVTLFALIDHSGEAEKVGMAMRPTKLLIFGSPRAGTPLMVAAPRVAIDLPLKILVWEDAGGKSWVSYNSPSYLQARHGVPPELLQNIAVVETLANSIAQ